MKPEHPPATGDEDRAMQYALRVLATRARSELEMRRKLERKGYASAVTDRTLAKLARLGLLDDREFARNWIAGRPGRGPWRLQQELRQKGIDRQLAEELVASGISADEEWQSAWQVARRAVQRNIRPLSRNEILRVRRLLLRRGFASDVVGRVCSRLTDDLTAEGDWLE